MKKKVKTIPADQLARMTQRGFSTIESKLASFREETKSEFVAVRREMAQMATKSELRETEEHLLDAIRGIEVRKRDCDALQAEVEILSRRVNALEKKH